MVERKKTGRAKARKGVSHFLVPSTKKADDLVHLGQALIRYSSLDTIMHIFTIVTFRYPHGRTTAVTRQTRISSLDQYRA